MKYLIIIPTIVLALAAGSEAQTKKTTKKAPAKKTVPKSAAKKTPAKPTNKVAPTRSAPTRVAPTRTAPLRPERFEGAAEAQVSQEVEREIQNAMNLVKAGRNEEASQRLFTMSRSPKFADRRMQIKYLLGISLLEMKLYQVAAFQFIAVVRDGNSKFIRPALEKLTIAADYLNDDTILNYAMSKVQLNEFPKAQQDMLRFRIGEIQLKNGLFSQAADTLSDVTPGSEWYSKAKYLQGVAYSEAGKLNDAVKAFSQLVDSREDKAINDKNKVAGIMGMARAYYQLNEWEQSIEMYRRIPRDSDLWHDSLFEMSWANMRSAQFRNALSNFHSLHSPFYDDYYQPESLLLRSIVYLYICQYDEMEKTLDLFDKIHKPVLAALTQYLKAYSQAITYYQEIENQRVNFEELKNDVSARRKNRIPFLVARQIMKEGDVSRIQQYIQNLKTEQSNLNSISEQWRRSEIGTYSEKLIAGRLNNAKKIAGKYVRDHVVRIRKELVELYEQHGFARFEMLNGRKETIKKQMASKGLTKKQVDEDEGRDYFVQNFYEYYPFSGEYWLDEIGNYHYLGTQSCQ